MRVTEGARGVGQQPLDRELGNADETPGRMGEGQSLPPQPSNSRVINIPIPSVWRSSSNSDMPLMDGSTERLSCQSCRDIVRLPGEDLMSSDKTMVKRALVVGAGVLLVAIVGMLLALLVKDVSANAGFSPETSYQMVAFDHAVVVYKSMGEGGQTLAVKPPFLCQVIAGRRQGDWIALTTEPGFVKLRDGDVEVFRETPDGGSVGICFENSTTTITITGTSTTTTTTTATTTTATTLPPMDTVRGDWLIAPPSLTCAVACSNIGAHCEARSLQAHNQDVSDPAKMSQLVSNAGGFPCASSDVRWGTAKDIPTMTANGAVCFVSDAKRPADSFDCETAPPGMQQRLCFCEDWVASELAAPGAEASSGFESWQVVHYGDNPVKALKDVNARSLTPLQPCEIVGGRKEGEWLRLAGHGGFIRIAEGAVTLVESVASFGGAPYAEVCMHTTTSSTVTSTSVTTTSVTTSTSTRPLAAWPSLYCVSVVQGDPNYEFGLMKAQLGQHVGIFGCNSFGVFSTTAGLDLGNGVFPTVFKNAKVGVSKDSKTAANAQLFVNFWAALSQEGKYGNFDWTVKVDPDAVLIAPRLQNHLKAHTSMPSIPFAVANCGKWNPDGDIYGAAEIYSKAALEIYFSPGNVERCVETLKPQTRGEDLFMRLCLEQLGVSKIQDYTVLADERCTGSFCGNMDAAVYHAFKDVDAWFSCYGQAGR